MICPYHQTCGGCTLWAVPFETQGSKKINSVRQVFQQAGLDLPAQDKYRAVSDRGLRDRLDFQIRGSMIGLWNPPRTEITDLPECLQLSPALQDLLTNFRRLPRPVAKGSFRLRVSAGGLRGVWLDFANDDVKRLFAEKSFLQELFTIADAVEIGQRRKALILQNGIPRLLKEPHFHPWTRTWIKGEAFGLSSRIADFSQVGDRANQALIEALMDLLPREGKRLFEFGSGNGNLTFPALSRFREVCAFEFESSATLGLQASLESFRRHFPSIENRLKIHTGDFRKDPAALAQVDTVLVNPPRSGVGRFLENLDSSEVDTLVYMSCYPESMAKDLAPLQKNWVCKDLILVDQFPQTEHIEVLGRFIRR